jgi:hypothetical protein
MSTAHVSTVADAASASVWTVTETPGVCNNKF